MEEKSTKNVRLSRHDFAVRYTIYNVVVLLAWFFLIGFATKTSIGQLLTVESWSDFTSFNIDAFGVFISHFYWLWWFPITWYFSFQLTKGRLFDLGYSKWFGLLNFYPLLFAVISIIEIKSSLLGVMSLDGFWSIILFIIWPILKLLLVGILYFKKGK